MLLGEGAVEMEGSSHQKEKRVIRQQDGKGTSSRAEGEHSLEMKEKF